MIKDEVCEIVSMSFNEDTCYPGLRDNWSKENKTLGQCVITALVLNDFFGGNKNLKIYEKLDCKCALNWLNQGYYKKYRVFFEN